MKNNKKKSEFIILLIVWGLMICRCSMSGTETIKHIVIDINNSEYLSKYELEVYDTEISQRKTDKNNKSDSMAAWIQSKNDIMGYSMGFELNYILYEESWLLDSIKPIEKDKWQYFATETSSVEEVNEVIRGGINYYAIADMKKAMNVIDMHLQTRLRSILQWKVPRVRYQWLRKLGANHDLAMQMSYIEEHYQFTFTKTYFVRAILKERQIHK